MRRGNTNFQGQTTAGKLNCLSVTQPSWTDQSSQSTSSAQGGQTKLNASLEKQNHIALRTPRPETSQFEQPPLGQGNAWMPWSILST